MLKFNNGKFKILIFGDLHEKEDYKTSPNFKDMQKLMNASLDEYSPDLCVFMGDNCTTRHVAENPEGYRTMMADLCKPITDRGIPVAAILGNHEHDSGHEDEAVALCGSIDGVIMRDDSPEDVSGYANFKELIYSSDGKTPLFCLWFLDSGNICEDRNLSHYDYVHTDLIKWFASECEKLKELNGGKPMPSFVFQHMPVFEEYKLLRKAKPWELPVSVRGYNTRKKNFYVLRDGCKGYLGEGPCAPDYNNGQFEGWKKAGGIKAAFFGHDHLNDFSGYVDGIYLAQHKTSGFRAYTDGCRSCVRLVTLDENNLDTFTDELKHFKEFGLRSECLGPIFRNITDRQSITINVVSKSLLAVAGVTAGAVALNKFRKK